LLSRTVRRTSQAAIRVLAGAVNVNVSSAPRMWPAPGSAAAASVPPGQLSLAYM
jgi:hypothetical protein